MRGNVKMARMKCRGVICRFAAAPNATPSVVFAARSKWDVNVSFAIAAPMRPKLSPGKTRVAARCFC